MLEHGLFVFADEKRNRQKVPAVISINSFFPVWQYFRGSSRKSTKHVRLQLRSRSFTTGSNHSSLIFTSYKPLYSQWDYILFTQCRRDISSNSN